MFIGCETYQFRKMRPMMWLCSWEAQKGKEEGEEDRNYYNAHEES